MIWGCYLKKSFHEADADIRALVITGSGEKAFVAGADIGEMSTLTKEGGEAFGKHGNTVFRAIETLPIPTIAAVNGFALGGGCELSMACDIRICADTAVFGPVSYTHLDVYKRQVVGDAVPVVVVLYRGLHGFLRQHGAVPVSYTHLDVYKRQPLWSPLYAPASHILPGSPSPASAARGWRPR